MNLFLGFRNWVIDWLTGFEDINSSIAILYQEIRKLRTVKVYTSKETKNGT